jgi:hypothetical protein
MDARVSMALFDSLQSSILVVFLDYCLLYSFGKDR